jgi:hypothetical protein
MVKDTLLVLIHSIQVESGLLLLFFLGLRKFFSRGWQIYITYSLLAVLSITIAVFIYVAYSNGMIKS